MFKQIYRHDVIRKYVIFFGSLFNEIYLSRGNDAVPEQVMRVPLNYGPKEKYLARLEGNPDLERPIAITLPRMSFEIVGYEYDADRMLPASNKICAIDPDNPGKKIYQNSPVPWNFHFNLYIMVKNAVDGTRIVEQILPFFTPSFTGTLKINPEMGEPYDIPLTLNTLSCTDTYEGSFEDRRAIIWTLGFTLKGWIFGPIRRGSIIKQAEVYIRIPKDGVTVEDAVGHTDPSISITVTPGLTIDGEPTSDPALTIDKDLIQVDDNYGFITEYEEYI